MSIETLRPGDRVVCRDERGLEASLQSRRIEEVFVRTAYQLQVLTLQSSSGHRQTLQTTNEHPVYVPDVGWVKAADLKPGDCLVEPGGELTQVIEARYERHPDGITVYNFRVAEHHTYFVRARGSNAEPVWVHNATGYSPQAEIGGKIYKKGWPGEPVIDHRLSRAVARVFGGDPHAPANLVLEAFEANARKGAR